jgi:glycosyltransferase involved in cell wall biosynthesis
VAFGGLSGGGAVESRTVALDARLTAQMSAGMKTYASELASRLPRVAPDLRFVPLSHGGNFGWDEQVRLPLAIRRARAHLTHYLSLYAPLVAPRPYVVTIHDLIHLRFPKYFKSKVGPYYFTAVRRLCSRAARVITDDERTVRDLGAFLHVPPQKVRVIPLGAADAFFTPVRPHRGVRRYLLYAGNHRAHKDLPTLFKAWSGVDAQIELDVYLTGPGDLDEYRRRYRRERGEIVALGEVEDSALAAYYAGAAALVHPALCEGFGLPMLEAMAARCPVIACSDALPRVLAGSALTFAAGDAPAARKAIERVLTDEGLARSLVDTGYARARTLTWDACAMRTADVYREILMEQAR